MQVKVDDGVLFSLSTVQEDVLKNDISSVIFDNDMKSRLQWVWTQKYEECFRRLKEEWDPKLIAREIEIPSDPDEYAAVVFNEDDYKDKVTRESEAQ